MKLENFPSSPQIMFYGEGKVITILREDKSPILTFKNNDNEEFSLPIFLHKKHINSNFEIIR